jgi:3-phenylpropionate/trans-cinnamate dioxygenase ferredoxin subunit
MESVNEFVTVARTDEIAPGTVKVVRIDDEPIGIANVDGEFYAFADVCTHDDGPVAEGTLEDHCIECPRHGARFDIRSGAVKQLPAVVPIPVYDLKVENGEIKVSAAPRE